MSNWTRRNQATLTAPSLSVSPLPASGALPACYPWPELEVGPEPVSSPCEAVQIGNDHASLTCVPSLGCRIVSIGGTWDGRAEIVQSGPRGASWAKGIEFLAGRSTESSLGPTDVRTFEEATGTTGIIFAALTPEADWHGGIAIAGDDPWFTLDVRLHSRSWLPGPGHCGIRVHGHSVVASGEGCVLTRGDDETLFVWWEEPGTMAVQTEGGVDVCRASSDRPLAPRATRSLKVHIAPLPQGPVEALVAPGIVLSQVGPQCTLWAAARTSGTLVVLPRGSAQIEAEVRLEPSTPVTLQLPMGSGLIEQAALKTASGTTHLSKVVPALPILERPPASLTLGDLADPRILGQAVDDPAVAAVALTSLACLSARKKDWQLAAQLVERALGVNPEDQFLWWMAAAVAREQNMEPQPEFLLNAHYLAPHDPLLRAESFLSAMSTDDASPGQMLTPLAADPNAVADVANTLAELGMDTALFRFVDEVLRQADFPLLRYILADRFLTASRMEATAAEHVAAAAKSGLQPPFPYRPHEIGAVLRLAERFPNDHTLATYASLARRVDARR